MFGTYQQSSIRIEIEASAETISRSLTEPERLRKWLYPQQIDISDTSKNKNPRPVNDSRTAGGWSADGTTSARLSIGQTFDSTLGFVKVSHRVEQLSAAGIRFLLSGSIDGFHEWQWGDGWVQSRLEGISILPLNLGQTLSLVRLKQYLQQ
ncbi:MAG: Polyketide cyclase / dehydrase and lipid transport [Phormidesmis priestleyi Ana]|uniref:Polyketide cyclase / dehydrase and lipid transport n=1 Tax=Phormidesmis priestleyi Ana TaxID=1666911 RepID=A0A0P8BHD8_9CYAN|nr:MAG: Polyketide cyclase / dehydrase and lipid transport [Phormidesmis priestleyi Ana]